MGLMNRMTTIVKAKLTRLLEGAEDPRETLDYSYQKQLEMLQNVKRGIADVVTSRRRLELQAARLQENLAKLDGQARQALAAGREDLARLALTRKQAAQIQLQGLATQIDDLGKEQEKLTGAEVRLSTKVESFRTRKEVIKAQYSAAEAQVRIGEAVTGISEEMADVGMSIERAEDKTEQLRARAGAIDELVAAGTLEDFTGGQDEVERELAKIQATTGVEQELAALKQQMAPKQLKEGK
ncbi:MAG TPA: PspA/IM30 family protein [Dehalococcoidia bacterium]|nr:PspA/IM30 family protein [Dehalococcoidia bacterium]HLE80862.1 PspA/IM30 family protein [Dehalococcoidia bacterium]